MSTYPFTSVFAPFSEAPIADGHEGKPVAQDHSTIGIAVAACFLLAATAAVVSDPRVPGSNPGQRNHYKQPACYLGNANMLSFIQFYLTFNSNERRKIENEQMFRFI